MCLSQTVEIRLELLLTSFPYSFAVKSLLERIMETKPYRRMLNYAYNPMILTKLVRNFRSHKAILDVPNELFYDGELEVID